MLPEISEIANTRKLMSQKIKKIQKMNPLRLTSKQFLDLSQELLERLKKIRAQTESNKNIYKDFIQDLQQEDILLMKAIKKTI